MADVLEVRGTDSKHRQILFGRRWIYNWHKSGKPYISAGQRKWQGLRVDLNRKLVFPNIVESNLRPDAVLVSQQSKTLVRIDFYELQCTSFKYLILCKISFLFLKKKYKSFLLFTQCRKTRYRIFWSFRNPLIFFSVSSTLCNLVYYFRRYILWLFFNVRAWNLNIIVIRHRIIKWKGQRAYIVSLLWFLLISIM